MKKPPSQGDSHLLCSHNYLHDGTCTGACADACMPVCGRMHIPTYAWTVACVHVRVQEGGLGSEHLPYEAAWAGEVVGSMGWGRQAASSRSTCSSVRPSTRGGSDVSSTSINSSTTFGLVRSSATAGGEVRRECGGGVAWVVRRWGPMGSGRVGSSGGECEVRDGR